MRGLSCTEGLAVFSEIKYIQHRHDIRCCSNHRGVLTKRGMKLNFVTI